MGTMLYEHNRTAYEAACRMMQRSGKAAVIHPTGTGKSFIAFRLCQEHPQQAVCWLSPSEYIFRTQQENWQKAGGMDCANIRFFTYARLMLLSREELLGVRPDFIVLDEFHRCGAKMWGQGVAQLLSLFPAAPLLGLSATNIRYLDNQRDMADELFDGCIASRMTLGEAIVRGILSPPKYVRSVFAYQRDLKQYEARIRTAKSKAVRAAAQREMEALRRALEQAEGMERVFERHMTERTGKYLVFCADYRHMREMIAKVPEWFGRIDQEPHVYSVYSEEPGTSKTFADFKADNSAHLKLLFCIDMLNEGIHVDDISGVILLRPTVSPIIYKQQIGRALSAGKKKNAVIFDVVQNIENLCSIGTVEEEMRAAAESYRRQGREEWIVHERFQVADEVADCVRLFERLEGTLSASWDLMYAAAERYYREHGDLEIPKRYVTPEGLSLGQWLDTQRRVYRRKVSGILTGEQVKRLEAIGMRWKEAREAAWERYYAQAERYYREHGNLLVPARAEVDGVALGRWIAQLRVMKKNRQRVQDESCQSIDPASSSNLRPEQVAALERIGMVWDVPAYLWEQNYRAAKRYYQAHGDLDVPSSYVDADGVRLGAWVRKMRMLMQVSEQTGTETGSRKGYLGAVLSPEQAVRLEQIGMTWEFKQELTWEKAYQSASTYFSEHGNLNIPVAYATEEGFRLGKWMRHQRDAYRSRTLSSGRREKLEQIGMVWEVSGVPKHPHLHSVPHGSAHAALKSVRRSCPNEKGIKQKCGM